MNPIPITWCLAGAGATALLCAWGGWTVNDWRHDSKALAAVETAAKKLDAARATVDRAATAYEQEKPIAAAQSSVRESTLREIYKDRPVPADCAVPDAARSVLDNAVGAANARAAGQPAAALPAATQAADAAH
ncbi:hypothetical protein [Novosphingobium sp. KA1]|uniref:hypothetical protein n=1 Tax=Novosphingobium sp. (strain KA1) TaxID=164608 RepID=UPI001A8E952D|nr:hypothetical protein [Novosphingobium sp. KA1]QSR16086.1 hypothetical protein CA833_02545 [Novosphingobium sp. KA1]